MPSTMMSKSLNNSSALLLSSCVLERFDLNVRIQIRKARLRRLRLRLADIARTKRNLPLQVGEIDDVEIDEAEFADAGRGEIQTERRAESTGADQQHLGVLELELTFHADLGHDQVAAVAQDLFVGEAGRRSCAAGDAVSDCTFVDISNPSNLDSVKIVFRELLRCCASVSLCLELDLLDVTRCAVDAAAAARASGAGSTTSASEATTHRGEPPAMEGTMLMVSPSLVGVASLCEVTDVFVVDVDIDEAAQFAVFGEQVLLQIAELRGQVAQSFADGCRR